MENAGCYRGSGIDLGLLTKETKKISKTDLVKKYVNLYALEVKENSELLSTQQKVENLEQVIKDSRFQSQRFSEKVKGVERAFDKVKNYSEILIGRDLENRFPSCDYDDDDNTRTSESIETDYKELFFSLTAYIKAAHDVAVK